MHLYLFFRFKRLSVKDIDDSEGLFDPAGARLGVAALGAACGVLLRVASFGV